MEIRKLLEKLVNGEISVDTAEKELRTYSIEYVEKNIAKLDPMRERRSGVPEVILAQGKEFEDLLKIILATIHKKNFVVVSKLSKNYGERLCIELEKNNLKIKLGINSSSLLVYTKSYKFVKRNGKVGILCAGTSDIGIAEEARLMAEVMGCETQVEYDVGISGVHRTLEAIKQMIDSKVHVIIVVAGMEGTLASFICSITDIPIVGVPTSIGYGFGSNGISALTSMLQTCSIGMTVVNIDNGIGAGAFAALVANRMELR